MKMLEDVQLGFDDRQCMRFSACRDCSYFRAFSFDGKAGFCCVAGKKENFLVPFDYPSMDRDGREECIRLYQENGLPDDCKFHTQCSMLNFMEDDSVAGEIASENYVVERTSVKNLDTDCDAFGTVSKRDSSFPKWCESNPDATAYVLKKDGECHGFAVMTVEKDADYSWIQPGPPSKHYLQSGTTVERIVMMFSDGEVRNGEKIMLACAYSHAIESNAEEFCAIAHEDMHPVLSDGGFQTAGWVYGGDGSDDGIAARVMVKKVNDLEETNA